MNPDSLPKDSETLRAIYVREAPHRPHWPPTLEFAMRDPLILRLLRLMRDHPSAQGRRQGYQAPQQCPPGLDVPPLGVPTLPAVPRGHVAPRNLTPFLDWKSRAAGEKPDQD